MPVISQGARLVLFCEHVVIELYIISEFCIYGLFWFTITRPAWAHRANRQLKMHYKSREFNDG